MVCFFCNPLKSVGTFRMAAGIRRRGKGTIWCFIFSAFIDDIKLTKKTVRSSAKSSEAANSGAEAFSRSSSF